MKPMTLVGYLCAISTDAFVYSPTANEPLEVISANINIPFSGEPGEAAFAITSSNAWIMPGPAKTAALTI